MTGRVFLPRGPGRRRQPPAAGAEVRLHSFAVLVMSDVLLVTFFLSFSLWSGRPYRSLLAKQAGGDRF